MQSFRPPVTITKKGKDFYIKSAANGTIKWALPVLKIDAAAGQTLDFNEKQYPRTLMLHGKSGDKIDVINALPIEEYLPGVLARELYPNWNQKAFDAQAIAARSYALWELTLHTDRYYDLESTTASQAYVGKTKAAKPLNGVRNTRGRVLVWDSRIVPAFYSASHGGVANDASAALIGKTPQIPPLHGGRRGDFANISSGKKVYAWGPQSRDRKMLARRFAAYGKARNLTIQYLKDIKKIGVTKKSKAGRPIEFAVVDVDGKAYRIPCEYLRNACNYSGGGLPKVARKDIVKSSFVKFRFKGNNVLIWGRGYGHGVGMSQWGAQGMALRGYPADKILRNYYPGAKIQQIYK
ncbi:SpoIID/LytB domain-containing protein [Poriferisphaera sp. WC338]|uniref:SpoIID/LytB domain-containing protein n=1 Tax=Poriferisphaera sp. WC338 TaxID=3425129 RepID=UPI003D81516F